MTLKKRARIVNTANTQAVALSQDQCNCACENANIQ